MAPQNKRANTSKAPVTAKKAKVQEPEESADPIALLLGPILAALSTSKLEGSSCDMLEAALPHCLADAPAQRHAFQARIIALTTSALKDMEESAHTELKESESGAENFRSQATVARSDFEAAKQLANAKKEESDAQGVAVDKLDEEVKMVKLELEGAVQKKTDALASKEGLVAEQEAFQKVLDDLWQPLKASTFSPQAWRKKDKCVADLVEKLRPLGIEASLISALQVALKMKLDQRSSFAQRALASAEDAFEKHKASVAQRIVDAGSEEVALDKANADAEAKLAEVQARHDKERKEYFDSQNSWAELETKAEEARNAADNLDAETQGALEEVETFKSQLNGALAISVSFAALLDPPVVQEQALEEVAQEAVLPSSGMEVEAEAVAAA